MSATGEWTQDALSGMLLVLAHRVGTWNYLGPPLGERHAGAIKAGHGAIDVIDDITGDLRHLRDQLIRELRTDEDLRGARVDQMLPQRPASGSL